MSLSEFTKLPKDTYAYDVWRRAMPVETSLGSFHVELHTPGDSDLPDAEMFKRADALAGYVASHSDQIWDSIFRSFRDCAATAGPDWLEGCEVPADLTREQVGEYCEPAICITRQNDAGGHYRSEICVFPQWDEEHGLALEFRDGAIVPANEAPSKRETGPAGMVPSNVNLADHPDEIIAYTNNEESKPFLAKLGLLNKLEEAMAGKEALANQVCRIDVWDHPTHWISASYTAGFDRPDGNGFGLRCLPKSRYTREYVERFNAVTRT